MSRTYLKNAVACFLALVVALGPATALAEDSYYMLMFGQQVGPLQPELSHTFATFVKAAGDGPDKAKYKLEGVTISWMPRKLDPKALRRPEEGVNLNLPESLRLAKSVKAEVTVWGAFQIQKELYDRALKQEARLKRGDIDYKALDVRFRPDKASNCMHAVCDIDTDKGLFATGAAHGNEASLLVLKHLARWIIRPDQRHEWLNQRLELDQAIVRRDLEGQPAEGLKK